MKNKTKKLFAGILVGTMLLTGCAEEGKDKQGDVSKPNKEVYMSFNDGKYTYNFDEVKKANGVVAGLTALQSEVAEQSKLILIQNITIDNLIDEYKIEISDAEKEGYIIGLEESMGGKEVVDAMIEMYDVDKDTFYDFMLYNLKSEKIREKYMEENKMKKEDIQKEFDDNKQEYQYVDARHILVEDEKLANEIYEKLQKGEDFEKLAQEHSIDKVANEAGGKVGRVNYKEYDPTFVDAAFKLKKGEISKPVKTQFGYHIIEALEIHLELDEDMEKAIEKTLLDDQFNKFMAGEYDKIKEDVEEVKEDEAETETTDKKNEKVEDNASKEENVDNEDEVNDADDVEEIEEEPAKKKVN